MESILNFFARCVAEARNRLYNNLAITIVNDNDSRRISLQRNSYSTHYTSLCNYTKENLFALGSVVLHQAPAMFIECW